MASIRLRRGTKANLPTLAVGEPALCTDTGEVYIGSSSGNLPVSGSTQSLTLAMPVSCADGISKSVSGSYVRCGDMVTVGVAFSVETATTLTGTLAITGLPFTAKYDAYAALAADGTSHDTSPVLACIKAGSNQIVFVGAQEISGAPIYSWKTLAAGDVYSTVGFKGNFTLTYIAAE